MNAMLLFEMLGVDCFCGGICLWLFHISDSGTRFWIQSVISAGRIPTKNTYRQLAYRKTIPDTSAASAKPIAQELCTTEIAFARNSSGQVSATRVAPVFHSPPIPSPRMKRNTASINTVVESPEANEQIEYVRILSIRARLRPTRSARKPKSTRPIPDASRASVQSSPEV